MPEGLQVRDASGNLILDLTNRLGRILGSITIGATSGTTGVIAGAEQGTLFYTVNNFTSNDPDESFNYLWDRPTITVANGNEIRWQWPTSGSFRQESHTIFYGVY